MKKFTNFISLNKHYSKTAIWHLGNIQLKIYIYIHVYIFYTVSHTMWGGAMDIYTIIDIVYNLIFKTKVHWHFE